MKPGILTGVGVGPGDPDLVTVAALLTLKQASRVIAPSTDAGQPGRAETVVAHHLPGLTVERTLFEMAAGDTALAATYGHLAEQIGHYLRESEDVAFITLGDPNLFSTFTRLRSAVLEVAPWAEVRTVPGVFAFQDLASKSTTTLAVKDESVVVVDPLQGTEALVEALADPRRTIVVYKGGRDSTAILRIVEEAHRLEGTTVGIHLGYPDERIIRLGRTLDLGGDPFPAAPYLSTIIIPAVR